MKLKYLFTVPEGEKVTEKHLRRVLIASICSILLCMCCLVSTTWAWFTVSLENKGNTLTIATVTVDATIKKGEDAEDPAALPEGEYTLKLAARTDATNARSTVYVLLTVKQGNATGYYYVALTPNAEAKSIEVAVYGDDASLTFSPSWVAPGSEVAKPITEGKLVIGEPPPAPTTQPAETTAPTQPAETEPVETTVPTDPANNE